MAEKQTLVPFERPADDCAMLCPDTGLALAGQGSIGWHCGKCGVLLLEGVHERQVLDVLIRYYGRGFVGATPSREPGEPQNHLVKDSSERPCNRVTGYLR